MDFSKPQDGFFPLGFSVIEPRILPLAILLRIKLLPLRSFCMSEILPAQLLIGTLYLKLPLELIVYILTLNGQSQYNKIFTGD